MAGNAANIAPTVLEECDWDGSVKFDVPKGWLSVTDYENELLPELEGDDLIESLCSQMKYRKKSVLSSGKRRNKIEGWDTMACPAEPNGGLGSMHEKRLPTMKFFERGGAMMRGYFTSVPIKQPVTNAVLTRTVDEHCEIEEDECEFLTGYWSDTSDVDEDKVLLEDTSPITVNSLSMMPLQSNIACPKFPIRAPPPLKHHRLEIPVWVVRKEAQEAQEKKLWEAYKDIQRQIKSAHPKFVCGVNSLQAYRAHTIQTHLHLKKMAIDASKQAAESQGFAENWGG
ncbi:hypothetical protein K443DRAFT_15402 [Laccaria amethystina LaAM-08-1]|uniref:Uncharacterized protein n=1 Tax=Laccaria amethystina LaAM-08-1 TaxID=1095629 RepID=A0A0C9X104_9AGAR|nr:hypothetical protein K443DRAFT_15402 [Laccaria amethystina LaAM-08-1]